MRPGKASSPDGRQAFLFAIAVGLHLPTASAHGHGKFAVNTFPPVRIRSGAPGSGVCPCKLAAVYRTQTAASIDGRITYLGRRAADGRTAERRDTADGCTRIQGFTGSKISVNPVK
jgi:hypothetical protein